MERIVAEADYHEAVAGKHAPNPLNPNQDFYRQAWAGNTHSIRIPAPGKDQPDLRGPVRPLDARAGFGVSFVMVESVSAETQNRAEGWRQPDLTPRDWLDAGQSLLKRGGLKALKLHPLADELRVSTGSFYHHFPDFDAYQGRLATYFAEQQINDLIDAVSRAEPSPVGRVRLLSAFVVRHGLARFSLAMRAWGESDDRARAAVERHDDILLGYFTRCLMAAGFPEHDARLRGYALIAVGLCRIHAPDLHDGRFAENMLRLLCAP